jgi:predicted N-acetyltransferase YhbS
LIDATALFLFLQATAAAKARNRSAPPIEKTGTRFSRRRKSDKTGIIAQMSQARARQMIETSNPTKGFKCRVADANDKSGIWDVLFEVAADIPARAQTPEDQENLKAFISEWVDLGSSLVAVDSNGLVIGFVLSTPDNGVRLQEKNMALNLPYISVSEKWQKNGVLTSLLKELKDQGRPLTVSVLNANKSNMVANLEKAGFAKQSRQDRKQVYLRWDPPDSTQTSTKA